MKTQISSHQAQNLTDLPCMVQNIDPKVFTCPIVGTFTMIIDINHGARDETGYNLMLLLFLSRIIKTGEILW